MKSGLSHSDNLRNPEHVPILVSHSTHNQLVLGWNFIWVYVHLLCLRPDLKLKKIKINPYPWNHALPGLNLLINNPPMEAQIRWGFVLSCIDLRFFCLFFWGEGAIFAEKRWVQSGAMSNLTLVQVLPHDFTVSRNSRTLLVLGMSVAQHQHC